MTKYIVIAAVSVIGGHSLTFNLYCYMDTNYILLVKLAGPHDSSNHDNGEELGIWLVNHCQRSFIISITRSHQAYALKLATSVAAHV